MTSSNFRNAIILTTIAAALALVAYTWGWVANSLEDRRERRTLRERWADQGEFVAIPHARDQINQSITEAIATQKHDAFGEVDQIDLVDRIMGMFDSFHGGNWDRYRSFHFPVPTDEIGGMKSDRIKIIRAAYEKRVGRSAENSEEELFVQWGQILTKENPRSYGHDCWQSVDIKNVTLLIARTNSIPSLHHFARSFEQLSGTSVFESVVAFPFPDATGKTKDDYVYAQLRVPVAMRCGKIGIYPIYAQFCWNPTKRSWIPTALALPSTEKELRIWF